MKFAHIVFETPHSKGSGASLRNYSIGLSLLHLGQSSTIVVQDYFPDTQTYPTRKPSYIEADLSLKIIEDVVARVEREKVDLVIIDGIFLADISRQLARNGKRVIVDMHNIESSLSKEIHRAHRGWLASKLRRKRWLNAQIAEQNIAEQVSAIWVCSENDAASLRSIVGKKTLINIVPNPVPAWCNDVSTPAKSDAWTVKALFIGHLGYRPNTRAAERLMRSIYPSLLKSFPDAALTICGRTPGEKLLQLANKTHGARIVESPKDLTPFYQQSTMTLIPLTEGGGTRLKVLEAMAMGLPVIASAKAVEGLAIIPEEMYLRAESNSEFVTAVQRLSDNEILRNLLTEAGRRFVKEHHSIKTIEHAISDSIKALSNDTLIS